MGFKEIRQLLLCVHVRSVVCICKLLGGGRREDQRGFVGNSSKLKLKNRWSDEIF
jgi:hypothetical protein